MRIGVHPFAILRAALLCALFAFNLGPQTADAHVDDGAVSAASVADTNGDHGKAHSLIKEAFEECHPDIDCSQTAHAVEPMLSPDATSNDGEMFRPVRSRRDGHSPNDDPPPPRASIEPRKRAHTNRN